VSRVAWTWIIAAAAIVVRPAQAAELQVPPELEADIAKKEESPTRTACWVACDGYRPLAQWKAESEPVDDAERLPFAAQCYPLADHAGHTLIGRESAGGRLTRWGWVRKDIVVHGVLRVEGSGIERKAMPIVRVGDQDKNQHYLPAPDKTSTPRPNQFQLYNTLFVYSSTADGDYLLLGKSPLLDANNAGEVLLGWIPADQVLQWNTAEGLAWDVKSTRDAMRRKMPGYVFETAKDAVEAAREVETAVKKGEDLSAVNKRIHEKSYFKEPRGFDEELAPYEPYENRYPLLPKNDLGEKVRAVEAELKNELMRVGAIGNWGKVDQREVDKLRYQIKEVAAQFAELNILFVINQTDTVKPHFDVIADLIDVVIENSKQGVKALKTLKLGVSFYSDIPLDVDENGIAKPRPAPAGLSAAVCCNRLADVINGEIDRGVYPKGLSQYVRDKKRENVGGHDYRDAVFEGLYQSIKQAKFSPQARKVVILIGDAGDAGQRDGFPPLKSVDDAAMALRIAGGSPIELHVWRLELAHDNRETGAQKEDRQKAHEELKTQINRLREKLSEDSKHGARELVNFYDASNLGFANSLRENYQRLLQQQIKLQADLQKAIDGRLKEMPESLRKKFVDEGVPLGKLQEDERQFFQEGYIWRYAPEHPGKRIPQVHVEYLIAEKQFIDFMKLLDDLGQNTMTDETNRKAFITSVSVKLREQRICDDDKISDNKLLAEYRRKKLGLVPRKESVFETVLFGNQATPQDWVDLYAKAEKLRDVCNDKRYQWKKEVREQERGKPLTIHLRDGEEKPCKRWFERLDDEKCYWLEEDEVP